MGFHGSPCSLWRLAHACRHLDGSLRCIRLRRNGLKLRPKRRAGSCLAADLNSAHLCSRWSHFHLCPWFILHPKAGNAVVFSTFTRFGPFPIRQALQNLISGLSRFCWPFIGVLFLAKTDFKYSMNNAADFFLVSLDCALVPHIDFVLLDLRKRIVKLPVKASNFIKIG